MALAPFFFRTYMAIGAHAGVTRDELQKILSTQVIRVAVGEANSVDGNERWISELLVNLLARLYPVLSITGPESACRNLYRLARDINPDIEIDEDKEAAVTVFVGTEVTSENGFTASASGWVASVGTDPTKALVGGPTNPYSSGAAAALAAGRIFETIVLKKDLATLADISLSLLDFGEDSGIAEPLQKVDLDEVAVVGIGAVGNPAIWAWKRHPGLSGRIHLVDPENVDLSNMQRYVLPLFEDVEKSKVQLAQRELQGTNLSVEPWTCRLEEFASQYPSFATLPTICISVDNVTDRRVAQALLPRLLVNGWTSDGGGLGVSWHRFCDDLACLGCLYHPNKISPSQTEMAAEALGIPHRHLADLWVLEKPLELEEIQTIEAHLQLPGQLADWVGKRIQDVYSGVICGQIGLDLPTVGHVATVPLAHQSVLAGILMAAELVKRSNQILESMSQKQPLVKWDQILAGPPSTWTAMRKKVTGCFCSDSDYQQIHTQKWG